MLKSVFKEIIIILLLILAIILLLGILFYDYMPSSKVLPEKVQEYAIDEDIQIELEKELNNANSDEIIKTYQLDATDLEVYEKTKEYNKGKVNPFAEYGTNTPSNSNSGTTQNNNSNGNSGSSTNNNQNSNVNNNQSSNTNSNANTNNNSNTETGSFLNITGK